MKVMLIQRAKVGANVGGLLAIAVPSGEKKTCEAPEKPMACKVVKPSGPEEMTASFPGEQSPIDNVLSLVDA